MSVYGEIYRDATAAHAQPLHLQKFAPDDRAHEMAVRKLRKTAETQRTVRARFIMDDRTLICHKVSCERCKNIPFRNRIYLSSFGYLEKMVVFDLSSRFKSKSTLFLLVVFCSITGILY